MMIKVAKRLLLVSVLSAGLCSCSDHDHDHEVKWQELRELDELAEFGEAYSAKRDMKSLKELVPKLEKACGELLNSKVPENAKDKAAIKTLLKDLQGLKQVLTKSASMTDAQLTSAVESFHPLVMTLMESAGLPHVHEHCEGHEGHEGHSCDHDHDHHDHEEHETEHK